MNFQFLTNDPTIALLAPHHPDFSHVQMRDFTRLYTNIPHGLILLALEVVLTNFFITNASRMLSVLLLTPDLRALMRNTLLKPRFAVAWSLRSATTILRPQPLTIFTWMTWAHGHFRSSLQC